MGLMGEKDGFHNCTRVGLRHLECLALVWVSQADLIPYGGIRV